MPLLRAAALSGWRKAWLCMSIAAKLLQDCFRVLCMRIAAIAGILLPVCLLQFLQYFLVHTFQVITFKTYHFSPPFFILIDIPGRRPSYFIQSIPIEDGKITAAQIQAAYDGHWNDVTHEHMVQPGMVYISQPTENGTTYTKAELEEAAVIFPSSLGRASTL